MDFDLVVRGGTLVDGTGAPAAPADVGVAGSTVAAVGDLSGARAGRVLDATDRLVTPGFVDLHTHLDAQVSWDPLLTSSCWHGVTSVVMGNCGVTFAPVHAGDREYLASMMESVEDIPARSILDGLAWDWTTYGDYLTALDHLPLGLNVGGMIGHCALRYHVMGDRSLSTEPGAPPSERELGEMARLVGEALDAGALGCSTSRTLRHRVPDGRFVPGTWAEPAELGALAAAMGSRGRGVLECAPRFDGDGAAEGRVRSELAWMRDVSQHTGRPVTFNLSQTDDQGEHYVLARDLARDANAAGAQVRPQTTSKCVGVLFSLAGHTPFDGLPAWRELRGRPVAEKLAVLREPEGRARLVDAARDRATGFEQFFVVDGHDGPRYDHRPGTSLQDEARRRAVSPVEAFVELALETEGRAYLEWPLLNQRLDAIEDMVTDPVVLMGLADAGAHVGQVMDASQPTYFLTYWVRERGVLTVEEAVRRITSDTASFMGLAGRGVLIEGASADLNVIDWDRLALRMPEFAHDFPHGAGRWTQRADGYVATIVNGTVLMEGGEHTGAFPGHVLRGRAAAA